MTRINRVGIRIAIFFLASCVFLSREALAIDDEPTGDANPVELRLFSQPPDSSGRGSYRQRRLRAEQEAAAGESWQQSFDYLASHAPDQIEVTLRSTFTGPDEILQDLATNPRVEKLIDVAISGKRKDREELRDRLAQYCERFIHDLPEEATPGKEEFQPSVSYPGLSLVFPYILAHFGRDGSDLSVYLKMDARYVAVNQRAFERDEPALAQANGGRRIWGEGDLYLTAACYVSLKRAANDSSGLDAREQGVIRRFVLWDAGRVVTNASLNTDPLDFAKEFVGN